MVTMGGGLNRPALMELVQKGKKRKGKKKKKKKNAIKVNQYIQTKPQGLGSCCASG